MKVCVKPIHIKSILSKKLKVYLLYTTFGLKKSFDIKFIKIQRNKLRNQLGGFHFPDGKGRYSRDQGVALSWLISYVTDRQQSDHRLLFS